MAYRLCLKCGTENVHDANYCASCGAYLGDLKPIEDVNRNNYGPQAQPFAKKHGPMAIIGFVLSFFGPMGLIGIILGVIDLVLDSESKRKHGLSIAAIVIGIITCVAGISSCTSFMLRLGEQIDWDTIVLADKLPDPPSERGYIYINNDEELSVEFYKVSNKEYYDYVDACKEMGYIVESEESNSSYSAYDTEGYELDVRIYGKSVSLKLTAPMKLETITWPTSELGNKIPQPKSTIGKFDFEDEYEFCVYVGETSLSDYKDYVQQCMNAGFNVDYSREDNYFSAYDATGCFLEVSYEGNNIMCITAELPYEEDVIESTGIDTETEIEETEQASETETTDAETETEEETEDESETEGICFDQDTAFKAAYVGVNNITAYDVFTSDGNTVDPSKLHSYSDRSGCYLDIISKGTWTEYSSDTWYGENLVFDWPDSYSVITVSLYVTYDGSNYIVHDMEGMNAIPGKEDMGTPMEQYEEFEPEPKCCLVVDPELLK